LLLRHLIANCYFTNISNKLLCFKVTHYFCSYLKAASRLKKKFNVHSGFLSELFFTTLWLLFKIAYRKFLSADLRDSFFSSFTVRQTQVGQTDGHTNIQMDNLSSPPPRPPRARDNQLITFDPTFTTSNERVFLNMSHLSARFSHSTPTSLNFESVLEPSNV
jgi:hypothetical protein